MNKQIIQRSPEWYEQKKTTPDRQPNRRNFRLSPWQKPDDVLREMVREHHGAESEFNAKFVSDHGNNNEQRALYFALCERNRLTSRAVWFFPVRRKTRVHPDGLTSDGGVLELKVPYSLRNGEL